MTGLIYAAIVAAWAAYLVPLALRRHEERARARSARRFSTAMHVLSRHSDPDPVRPLRRTAKPPAGAAARPRPSRAAAARAAARRRRVLGVLCIVGMATAGFACFGVVPWEAVAVPVGLFLVFLAVCRRQVRTEAEAYWTDAVARLPEPARGARVEATRSGPGDEPHDEPTVVLRTPAAPVPVEPPAQVVAVAVPTSEGGSLWDPLPITLPTYISKPAAPRTIRTVDLVHPAPPAPAAAKAADEVEAEPRHAVGQ